MTISINVNGLTLCHRGSGGISHNTLPDVCKTPGNGTPVPYQNEAYSRDLVKGSTSVFADGGNMIAIEGSQFSKSIYDEAGSMGGVVSGTHEAETDWITHSFDVFVDKKPACRLTDKLFMNHRNTVNMAGLKQRDLPKKDQDFFDKLCQMACECLNELKGKLEPGQTYQDCVRKKIDKEYYKDGYPKPDADMWREVSYDKDGWALKGSQANRNIPSSNILWPNTRRLDVAQIENGRVTKLYDMKFGNDTLTPQAERDYRKIAEQHTGDEDNFEEFRVDERCDCDDDWPPKQPAPVTVPAPQQKSLLDKFGDALASTTGIRLTGTALVAVLVVSELSRLFPPRNAVPVP
ncbi:DUF4150 domain-containing protein [Paraburkholderia kururiensis]|uniref:DUF4150 domain-containing protein n=1 Tax=Paraburkholderia kururiensis TaxID=984307 RepID=UPI0018F63A0B|nr:DUF4150 domain-containing protein [Paraburkholderia kururiensis]